MISSWLPFALSLSKGVFLQMAPQFHFFCLAPPGNGLSRQPGWGLRGRDPKGNQCSYLLFSFLGTSGILTSTWIKLR